MAAKTRKQQLEEMLADDPNDAFLRYGLGMEYAGEGNDEQAVSCFFEIFKRTPDYPPAYLQAGQVLTRLARTAEARDVFRKGIAIAERLGNAHAAGEMTEFLESLD